jgi:Flp pilus assembly pilin Flp
MRFLSEGGRSAEDGATMLEYGLMVALIAAVVMLAVGPLGLAASSFSMAWHRPCDP